MLINLLVGISLSMDAFSLSLVYGNLNIQKKDIYILSIIVGLYHFLMPIIGMYFGNIINRYINLEHNLIMFLILFIVGLEMIFESLKKNDEVKIMKLIEMLLFGFAVSIDSFSVGIGFKFMTNDYISPAITFSITSTIFTFLGLRIGKFLNKRIGNVSRNIGGIILIILAISYL